MKKSEKLIKLIAFFLIILDSTLPSLPAPMLSAVTSLSVSAISSPTLASSTPLPLVTSAKLTTILSSSS